jgi:hypothetical protein
MIGTFAVKTSSAKRLIARGVVKLEAVRKAREQGNIIIAGGTTNAYVAEELGVAAIENKSLYTAGIITGGVPCVTPEEQRIAPICLAKGKKVDIPWPEFLKSFTPDDVFIKGANALDAQGRAGILLGSRGGGTIGLALGMIASLGSHLIVPVGHEKMIPSCESAAEVMGIGRIDQSLGFKTGFMMLPVGRIITEVEALEVLFGVKARVVAAGGVGGMEGSVMIAVEGEPEQVDGALKMARGLMREPALGSARRKCRDCMEPCQYGARS